MRATARFTRHAAGLPEGDAASGDPSPFTARGVFEGLKACVRRRLGREDLQGVRVAVQGVGSVGAHLCEHLVKAGAHVVVSDINEAGVAAITQRLGVTAVAPEAVYDQDMDVFAPCALGGVLNSDSLGRLGCAIVAGGANNQLAEPSIGVALRDRKILYAPDYVINGGGIINVAAEVLAVREGRAYDRAWVEAKLETLSQTLGRVLDRALAADLPTQDVADEIARERLRPTRDKVLA